MFLKKNSNTGRKLKNSNQRFSSKNLQILTHIRWVSSNCTYFGLITLESKKGNGNGRISFWWKRDTSLIALSFEKGNGKFNLTSIMN